MFLWRDISDRYCCVHTHMFINLTSLLSHILFSFQSCCSISSFHWTCCRGTAGCERTRSRVLCIWWSLLFFNIHTKRSVCTVLYSSLFLGLSWQAFVCFAAILCICIFLPRPTSCLISLQTNGLAECMISSSLCWRWSSCLPCLMRPWPSCHAASATLTTVKD